VNQGAKGPESPVCCLVRFLAMREVGILGWMRSTHRPRRSEMDPMLAAMTGIGRSRYSCLSR